MFSFGLNSRKWVRAFQKTEKATKSYSKFLYNTWSTIIKDYQQDFDTFLTKITEKRAEFEDSLVFLEMMGFTKRFANIQNLVSWGFYHSALLELRFMLETAILAYYLDQQLPNTKKAEKIQLMQKHKGELWGNRLRRRAYLYDKAFGGEVAKAITQISNTIDEYMSDLSPDDWEEPSIRFSEHDFNQCVRHSKNVAVLIFKHFMKRFEQFNYFGDLTTTLEEGKPTPPQEEQKKGENEEAQEQQEEKVKEDEPPVEEQ